MKYRYYSRPEAKEIVYRAEPKKAITDEKWELYIGDGKWKLIEGLSAECEAGLMYGAWNDIVVMEISEAEAETIISDMSDF